ncbi:spore coat protein GerQ [Paenibacillus alkalitolerans]|uniref:spore coat protein GerQ n=1 Tax=Paenibacillus alkalitolerans TaxID=2799335 RepID=UPI0018F49A7D|nr:spore coat protein GerQ [Paenibacillus alkalitolerans]
MDRQQNMGTYTGFPGSLAGTTPGFPTYQTPTGAFPSAYAPIGGPIPGMTPMGGVQPFQQPAAAAPVFEESYIENILRLNLGKMATIYMTFENNPQWNAKVFKGRLEAAGRDHIIISDPQTGMRYLLLMVNLDYITFDEPLNYQYPFAGATPAAATPAAAGR